MQNPFELKEGRFIVLLNEEGQYSLWPASFDIPLGWKMVLSEHSKDDCVNYINKNWTDMRPNSLKLNN
ncbi:MbtH family protein [Heyndrickxia ginsengihumi]|uniref:MbtH family NRPS accessory protein n=1 Tax=Heyndrickxia ginsengihumi TaxID=363870 RepID=A0A0A6VAW5_9BACI|nr:MbtH family NRPS accessory protein [Heyndrickxia ginsengihumi]KHD85365.1 hypothetical protein NG54_09680 [Heyndrickxia ginsengihumi]MBE6183139.1 MbtH family NRPS accessory protein [Bacillus sp. (in: firmicutes)]MCM3024242.1 MbtH family NRPS accessory protein [Heyndrickxia ginsengihumi]NEY20598.1 MbtH family NRPS accessory protein [Heyndrickxia ginsengihumi]